MKDFKDKIIIITGASSGIGKALADELLKAGAKVAVCARNEKKLLQAFEAKNQQQVFLKAVDVSDELACQEFVHAVLEKWGRIDGLINNAGMSMRALFQDVETKVLRQLMDINFWGSVYMTKYALASILENKGFIVGNSSVAGFRALPARTGYSASKFALNGFLESLRTELLHTGVHVMIASPGFTASNIRNTSLTADGTAQSETPLDESKLMSAETCAQKILKGIRQGKRTVVITRQAWLTLFLSKFFPKGMDSIVYNFFKKEQDSPLSKA